MDSATAIQQAPGDSSSKKTAKKRRARNARKAKAKEIKQKEGEEQGRGEDVSKSQDVSLAQEEVQAALQQKEPSHVKDKAERAKKKRSSRKQKKLAMQEAELKKIAEEPLDFEDSEQHEASVAPSQHKEDQEEIDEFLADVYDEAESAVQQLAAIGHTAPASAAENLLRIYSKSEPSATLSSGPDPLEAIIEALEGQEEYDCNENDQKMRDASPSSHTSTIELPRQSVTPEVEDDGIVLESSPEPDEYIIRASPTAEDEFPDRLISQSQSGRHILLKTSMGSRIYTKIEDPNKFVIYASPEGPQIYQQAGPEGVEVGEFEDIPDVQAAPGQLPPATVFNADKVAFDKYPDEIQKLLQKGDSSDDMNLKDLKQIIMYRSKLEKGRRRGWKKYIVAATAMYRIGAIKDRYRQEYDKDFERYRKRVQTKIRRDTLEKMKNLINVSAGVDRLDRVIRENLRTEWPVYAKDL
ncbi:hypothetical protein PVAG01_08821 [Phlyctema vagabunda]|uniref:Uncharacterized protein n=1 Tax=Phlyctema vagabunda TaxID=108571 RepID=A0ABR4PAZ3_9HELO